MNLRKSAEHESCVLCGATGTTVLAHLPIAGTFGMGLKAPDWQAAYLCFNCHQVVDGPGRQDWKLRFLALVKTWQRWIDNGTVTIGKP